ncbi:DUF6053 domain-containing protein, partial [Lysobacter sp. 2RAB21]
MVRRHRTGVAGRGGEPADPRSARAARGVGAGLTGCKQKPRENAGFFAGGASAPMLLFQITIVGTKSIGAEAPPTKAQE